MLLEFFFYFFIFCGNIGQRCRLTLCKLVEDYFSICRHSLYALGNSKYITSKYIELVYGFIRNTDRSKELFDFNKLISDVTSKTILFSFLENYQEQAKKQMKVL